MVTYRLISVVEKSRMLALTSQTRFFHLFQISDKPKPDTTRAYRGIGYYKVQKCVPVNIRGKEIRGKMAVFWVVTLIALMMEAVQTSETSVISYQSTRRYNPEDSHLRTHRR
jgi:hypothetical protein